MRDPHRLEVMQRATQLTALVYVATSSFPTDEQRNLTSQLRRASVSIGSNIVEGCGRSTNRAYRSYLQNAMASATEVEYQLELAIHLGVGNPTRLHDALSMSRRVKQMIAKLTKAIRD
jgi:four helix bundle protein